MRINFYKLSLLITLMFLCSDNILAQANWTKYAFNPVLPAGPSGSWYHSVFTPWVIYNDDSSRYEMWFSASALTAVNARPWQIGYAKSTDGISWIMHPTPVLSPGISGSWDGGTVEKPIVIRENGQYKMWYSAGTNNPNKIGYATSPDGINWNKDILHNPIFQAGGLPWELGGVYNGTVLKVPGGYKIWYSGWTTTGQAQSIGYATSIDGIYWQRDPANPVLVPGSLGSWDDTWVSNPTVLFIANFYYMWYGGTADIYQDMKIGLATSFDGISWSKDTSNPVLQPTPGKWDGNELLSISVIKTGDSSYIPGDSLYAFYEGSGTVWQIGLAKCLFFPLPVELISFSAVSNDDEVIITWSTATETNNRGFSIERKTANSDYSEIGFVPGFGTTTEPKSYSFKDSKVTISKYTYRLKQIDFDGSYEYSPDVEVEVSIPEKFSLKQNYPNPFNPATTIGYGIQEKSNVKITVLNSIGEEVAVLVNEEKDSGYYTAEFNASNFPSGVYFYKITAGEFTSVKKMTLIK